MKGVDSMAHTTQVSFRIDEEVKKSAENVLNDMGLTMSAAITVFLKKISREHRIPFEISADPFYSESNIRYLERKKREIDEGKAHLTEHELIEVND